LSTTGSAKATNTGCVSIHFFVVSIELRRHPGGGDYSGLVQPEPITERAKRKMAKEIENKLKYLLMGNPEAEDESGRIGFLKKEGLSVEQFARKVGVTRTSIYTYLGDRGRPTLDTLVRMSAVIGISLAEMKAWCPTRERGRFRMD
jgi:DNA-binding XRE family transcriptional regulator